MLFDIMGFGKAPDAPVPLADPVLAGSTFRASLMLVADGLGATIDDFTYDRRVSVAATPFDVKAGRIEAGTVSAQRFGCSAIIGGRAALTIEHITRLGDGQAPEWPTGRGWKVTVEGRPSMVLESQHRHPRRGRDRSGLPRHRDARRPRHRARMRRCARHPHVSGPADDHGSWRAELNPARF